jgi:cell fate regulator YaaT (PSP1 superfamily)
MQSLQNIAGIKFRPGGRIYFFNTGDFPIKKGDQVIVETDSGLAIGMVATEVKNEPIHSANKSESYPRIIKKIMRKATDDDLRINEENHRLEKDARKFCKERIVQRNLPMKLIDLECTFNKSKMLFYFTAENRVDFRELVKDLVQRFKTRIELRQIGARQETRMVKGLGICGREVCCANLLSNFDRVSIKMAKEQSMSLNPEKISGLCGRLLCCLSYEYEGYLHMRKGMPKCGKTITINEGCAKVLRQNVLRGEITVALENGKETTLNIKDIE